MTSSSSIKYWFGKGNLINNNEYRGVNSKCLKLEVSSIVKVSCRLYRVLLRMVERHCEPYVLSIYDPGEGSSMQDVVIYEISVYETCSFDNLFRR